MECRLRGRRHRQKCDAAGATANSPEGPRTSSTANVHCRYDFGGTENLAVLVSSSPAAGRAPCGATQHRTTLSDARSVHPQGSCIKMGRLNYQFSRVRLPDRVKLVPSERAAVRHVSPSIEPHCLMLGRSTRRAPISDRAAHRINLPVHRLAQRKLKENPKLQVLGPRINPSALAHLKGNICSISKPFGVHSRRRTADGASSSSMSSSSGDPAAVDLGGVGRIARVLVVKSVSLLRSSSVPSQSV
jgi:hypothetical protein